MFDICKKCGKIVENIEQHREYKLAHVKDGLFRHRTMVYCMVKCPICGETYTGEFVVKRKSKYDYYVTDCAVYRIIHSDMPEAIDTELFSKNILRDVRKQW